MRKKLAEQHSGRLLNITYFEFRLIVHFTCLTMKRSIFLYLSLLLLVFEIINEETPTKFEALTKGIIFTGNHKFCWLKNCQRRIPIFFPTMQFCYEKKIEDMLKKTSNFVDII